MPENEKPKPRGFWGLLIDMTNSGALSQMPPSWAKVFLALYRHRNPQGFANPSHSLLAKEAGTDERTVRRFIRWAKVALGITVKRGRRTSSSYYLPLEFFEPWFQAMGRKRKEIQGRTPEHPQRTGGRFGGKKP